MIILATVTILALIWIWTEYCSAGVGSMTGEESNNITPFI